MTLEHITDALAGAIYTTLGFQARLLPQKAGGNTARIDLTFLDIEPCGENAETITFRAEYRTAGTHTKWLTETARLKRALRTVQDSYMEIKPNDEATLRAYWKRIAGGGWVYPSEDESSMPAEYVIPYQIELDIPTRLLED